MSDISKCLGKSCPIKNKCFRYLCIGSQYQTWTEASFKNGNCEFYYNLDIDNNK